MAKQIVLVLPDFDCAEVERLAAAQGVSPQAWLVAAIGREIARQGAELARAQRAGMRARGHHALGGAFDAAAEEGAATLIENELENELEDAAEQFGDDPAAWSEYLRGLVDWDAPAETSRPVAEGTADFSA
ncbi:hypothetical protein [Longimycelium tulufanense]|uniref:hypothetical protein n=1 Tax=Longimycelium tulufanense TaxID=907463 RepID=UPI001663D6B3|nr:hypothetical protein [Longimycelium tulufanense]